MQIIKRGSQYLGVRFDGVILHFPPEQLRQWWDTMGKQISAVFPVAGSVKMPGLEAFILSGAEFRELVAFVREGKPGPWDMIEHGHEVPDNHVSGLCLSIREGCWSLYVNRDFIMGELNTYNGSLEASKLITHEMAHVFEHLMLLEPGTVTKKFGWQ